MATIAEKLELSLDELVSKGPRRSGKGAGKAGRAAAGSAGGSAGNCRVFVGNLPFSATWQDLKDHMRQAGDVVHCDIIAAPGTANGSKGCGLVEFATVAAAKMAVEELSETVLKGRTIYIREDRETGLSIAEAAHRIAGRDGSTSRSGCRVFVGNLPFSATWKELKDHMRQAGNVLFCDVLAEPGTPNGSKGCGIVEYSSPSEARHAIRSLSESTLCGRTIFVREDREEAPRFGGGEGREGRERSPRRGAWRQDLENCRVFVGNLPYSVTWQELKDHMRQAGDVVHCDILAAPGTALGSKGCGIVEFATPAAAKRAIRTLTETEMKGRPIFVREDRES